MASSPRTFYFVLFVSFFILINGASLSRADKTDDADLDDDVAFLAAEESKDHKDAAGAAQDGDYPPFNFENYDDLEGDEHGGGGGGYEDDASWPSVDEKDVMVLKKENFSDFLKNNSYAMVEFYAPWCGHCQALAPEYAAAATELKGVAAFAKVDATEEAELAQKYDVQGFPTVYLFVDGEMHKSYEGQRTKDAIVTWVKKKAGPSIHNITTKEEAERVLAAESKIVLGFIDSLVGSESEELAAASRLEDEVSFYQTSSSDVAKIFQIESEAKRPALVLLKNEDEKLTRFNGDFTKTGIAEFVSTNKVPLLINFTRETAPLVFENPIKNQLILFATANDTQKYFLTFQEVAKAYKGKFVFVYVQMDNEDYGEAVSGYFGVSGTNPRVLVYTGNEDNRKFVSDGELTLSSIKSFAGDFLEDKLKPFYKSDPVPEKNDGDVKIVVGNNFDEIVLDESKDVLLEIYAPWCGHCQSFEPTYNKLGKYLKGIDSLVVAKMDGTTNEHPRAKADGFPTILFFPAGNKSFDPITVDTDRTVVALYKFLKKHASIPFKLQKPASAEPAPPKEESKAVDGTQKSNKTEKAKGDNVKDEL